MHHAASFVFMEVTYLFPCDHQTKNGISIGGCYFGSGDQEQVAVNFLSCVDHLSRDRV